MCITLLITSNQIYQTPSFCQGQSPPQFWGVARIDGGLVKWGMTKNNEGIIRDNIDITNAVNFILDSLHEHHFEDIEFLDEMTAREFGDDYQFTIEELNIALDQFRLIPRTNFYPRPRD
jgi:hypothetical protein